MLGMVIICGKVVMSAFAFLTLFLHCLNFNSEHLPLHKNTFRIIYPKISGHRERMI